MNRDELIRLQRINEICLKRFFKNLKSTFEHESAEERCARIANKVVRGELVAICRQRKMRINVKKRDTVADLLKAAKFLMQPSEAPSENDSVRLRLKQITSNGEICDLRENVSLSSLRVNGSIFRIEEVPVELGKAGKEMLLRNQRQKPKDKTKFKLKCIWMNSNFHEKELVVYYNEKTKIYELLLEINKLAKLPANGSITLMFLEITRHLIFYAQSGDELLSSVPNASTVTFRVEEIPKEILKVAEDERIIQVAHFEGTISNTHGVPFMIKLKDREPFYAVKERIQERLRVPDEEFKTYKYARIILDRIYPINERRVVDLEDFSPHLTENRPCAIPRHGSLRPWLGINHKNKGLAYEGSSLDLENEPPNDARTTLDLTKEEPKNRGHSTGRNL